MLDETHFLAISTATLEHIHDQLEQAFQNGTLEELELNEGILSIELESGQCFVISKHEPSRQMWLASPLSGGLHFDYCHDNNEWRLADGRTLKRLVAQELKQLCGLQIVL